MSSADPVTQPGSVIDVTDATFDQEVVERSRTTPVVVDLWAPWCGPCRQLGPILESVVEATGGKVVLAKVNVDENPAIAAAFRVQGIPAVFGLVGGRVVDNFVGAQGQAAVQAFVDGIIPTEDDIAVAALIEAGDEASLREALEIDPPNEVALVALAELLALRGDGEEALGLLNRMPETTESRRVAALARTGGVAEDDGVEARLDALLERIPGDDDARREYLDVLELLGPDDPRVPGYRKALTTRLF